MILIDFVTKVILESSKGNWQLLRAAFQMVKFFSATAAGQAIPEFHSLTSKNEHVTMGSNSL